MNFVCQAIREGSPGENQFTCRYRASGRGALGY